MEKKKIGIFSFFAGAGFLDLGFERTGLFETIFVNEYQKSFAQIYRSARLKMDIPSPLFGHQVADIGENLTNLNSQWLLGNLKEAKDNFDIVGFIGGPPCPDFSVAGKNRGYEGENGKLSSTYIELVCRAKPDFFLFENVKGLYRTNKHRLFFESLKNKLIDKGYYITEKLINAIEYGVPQDRDRIILVGFKRDFLGDCGFRFNGSPIIQNFDWSKNTYFTAADVFSMKWPSTNDFSEGSDRSCPADIPVELTVEHWFRQNMTENHPNAKHYFTPRAGLGKFQTIQEGDDSKKSYKRLHRWRYSPTAAYGNNEVHLHPYKARRITVAEALSIQSLPSDFIMPDGISLTDMFKSTGNGVPYLAAKGLALTIADFLFDNPNKDIDQPYEKINSKQHNHVYQPA